MLEINFESKKYYYSRYCRYGVNVVYEDSSGVNRFPGTIMRFKNRAARDAWVEDEVWNGTFHREAMAASDVRNITRTMGNRNHDNHIVWQAKDSHDDDHEYETL